MHTTTQYDQDRRFRAMSWRLLLVTLLVIWFCSILGPLSPITPVVFVGVMGYFLSHRRFLLAVLLVGATPASLCFCWGVSDYMSGNAILQYPGIPGTKSGNLDPDLRCGRSSTGCFVVGNEWVTQTPYNCAVRLCTTSFGWMSGTYEGPYPTETEAKTAVANGSVVSVGELRSDRISFDGVSYQLDNEVGGRLLDRLKFPDMYLFEDEGENAPDITAVVWKQQCLVLHIPVVSRSENTPSSAAIVLISRSAGRPFAYYSEGDYSHYRPPVAWKRVGAKNSADRKTL